MFKSKLLFTDWYSLEHNGEKTGITFKRAYNTWIIFQNGLTVCYASSKREAQLKAEQHYTRGNTT